MRQTRRRFSGSNARLLTGTALAGLLVLSGCATPSGEGGIGGAVSQGFTDAFNNPNACSNNSKDIGAVLGVLAGAGIGFLATGNAKGALIGAAAGGVAGFGIGAILDHRRCRLYEIAQANNLHIASEELPAPAPAGTFGQNTDQKAGLNVVIQDNGAVFEPGTANLTPNAQPAISQIAQTYAPQSMAGAAASAPSPADQAALNQRVVLVVSHTTAENSGPEAAQLSVTRAKLVAQQLEAAGVPAQNIYYQGAGNTQSAIPSDSPQAQAANSSVQIVDMSNRQALADYVQNNQPAPAASAIAATASTAAAPTETGEAHGSYHFGGQPVAGQLESVDIGPPPENTTLAFIGMAYAGTPLNIKACPLDKPQQAGAITNLATGEALDVGEDIPGFYGAPWAGGYNGNLVSILNAYAPKDEGATIPDPTLQVYKNYQSGDNVPSFSKTVKVNVYHGQNTTLYRIFADGPLECMDLVVPAGSTTGNGTIYYYDHSSLYKATGAMALQRN